MGRNFLQDYSLNEGNVIQRLLDGNGVEIAITEEHLDQPVFLKSTPRGLSLLDGGPIAASSLSQHRKTRARQAGIINRGNSSRREGLTGS